MRLDHVVLAATDLATLTDAAERVDLPVEPGGVHPDANTENALVGLADGSYLELLGSTGGDPGWWAEEIRGDAGPTDWCLAVEHAGETLRRSIAAGLGVRGPLPGSRERPDGVRLEWDLGRHLAPGLPFCVADRTPREWRVPEAAEGAPQRVDHVVLAGLPEGSVEALGRRYGLPAPVECETPLDATVRTVPGTPVAFATALGDRLAGRVERFGPGPCAFVLAGGADATERYALGEPEPWGDREVRWFDDPVFERRLGVLA